MDTIWNDFDWMQTIKLNGKVNTLVSDMPQPDSGIKDKTMPHHL